MILEAHEWLEEEKILKRVSYKKLGVPIGYSDAGMINAFKNKTLSLIQIQKIGQDLEFDLSKVSFIKNNPNSINEPTSNYDLDHKMPKSLTDSEKLDLIYKTVLNLKCEVDFLKMGMASLLDESSEK